MELYIYFSIVTFTGRLSGVFMGVRMGDHKFLKLQCGAKVFINVTDVKDKESVT